MIKANKPHWFLGGYGGKHVELKCISWRIEFMCLLLYTEMFLCLFTGSVRTRSQLDRSRRVALNTFTDTQTTGTQSVYVISSDSHS